MTPLPYCRDVPVWFKFQFCFSSHGITVDTRVKQMYSHFNRRVSIACKRVIRLCIACSFAKKVLSQKIGVTIINHSVIAILCGVLEASSCLLAAARVTVSGRFSPGIRPSEFLPASISCWPSLEVRPVTQFFHYWRDLTAPQTSLLTWRTWPPRTPRCQRPKFL